MKEDEIEKPQYVLWVNWGKVEKHYYVYSPKPDEDGGLLVYRYLVGSKVRTLWLSRAVQFYVTGVTQ